MRRPTSDVRQRETRRSTGLELNSSRRRNSSVPFSNVRLDKVRYSQDSDTDFLCDRAVEFMDSGDICSIVAVELAEQSVYFERLLRYHRGRGCIRLPEFLNAGFSAVIEYIRKGSTNINEENVYEVFIAADYLLVPKLKYKCSKYIEGLSKEPSTAINLWVTGRPLHWPEVGKMAFQKILEGFEKIWHSSEFTQLDYKDVETIVKNDSLNCKNEVTVFDAIMNWLVEDVESRTQNASSLLGYVRLGMLRNSEVSKLLENEHLKHIVSYSNILKDWPTSINSLMNQLTDKQKGKLAKPRFPHEVVCVFGGWCDGEGPRAAAQIFNPRANTWTLWTELGCQTQSPTYDWIPQLNSIVDNNLVNHMDTTSPELNSPEIHTATSVPNPSATRAQQVEIRYPQNLSEGLGSPPTQMVNACDTNCLIGEIPRRVYAGCVLVGNRVYLVGGFDGTNALKSTLCYDFEVDSGWYEISCMYEKRYYVSVAYAARYIYALGGHNGENQGRLDTAERYNLDENLWQPIASMNRIRSDAAAAELRDKVYVAGGFEGRRYHDSAEYYECDTNQWTLISRMHSPRGGISLAQTNGFIYAIGGNDGNSRLRSIERFDPDLGKWEIVGQMNKRKSNLSSAVLGDDIYIIGGWSDEPEAGILSLVERFDTKTRECAIIRPLTFPASATCACTLSNRHLVRKYIYPVVEQNHSTAVATENLLRVKRSGSPGESIQHSPATGYQMNSSTNNLDQLAHTTSLPLNNSANDLGMYQMSDLNQSSHIDYMNDSFYDSELDGEESDVSQSEIMINICGPEEGDRAQPLEENNSQGSSHTFSRECFVHVPSIDLPNHLVVEECQTNLRSNRRNRR